MDVINRNKRIILDYQNGVHHESIMGNFGISKTQLYRILREAGVQRPKSGHPCNTKEWLESRLVAGKTEREMSAEAGAPHGTMKSWILKYRGTKVKRKNQEIVLVDLPAGWDTAEWFKQKYEVEGLGAPSIAKLLGKRTGFVNSKLDKYGIQKRSIRQAMLKHRTRPTREWLQDNYTSAGWSIQRCADEFGVSFDTILDSLRDYGIEERDNSTQLLGDRNPFYGHNHTLETSARCAAAGARAGKEYWTTGDVEAKRELASLLNKATWADPERRQRSSVLISKLCAEGKCTPHTEPYYANNGDVLLLHSSWETVVAKFLDQCNCDWSYQELILPYDDGDTIRNFVVDFTVRWPDGLVTHVEVKNPHLLSQEKEQNKISALNDYCKQVGASCLVISEKNEIVKLAGKANRITWRSEVLFDVPRQYLDDPDLAKESLAHEIVAAVCPWKDPVFPESELQKDLLRLRDENLGGYERNGVLHSTAPNGGGMPGRVLTMQFFPHFWKAAPKRSQALPEAFGDPRIIYNCLRKSMSENESLSHERLLRELNFHYTKFGRVSLFAPGFARSIIKRFGMSGKRIFDPCCGWGGRLIGAFFEGCSYSGCDVSPLTCDSLRNLAIHLDYDTDIIQGSCVEIEWPECDLILTSPPFYDVELYVGGDQVWKTVKSRQDWFDSFIRPFLSKIGDTPTVLYLDKKTADEFSALKKPDAWIEVANKRHARRISGLEHLICYNVK